MAGIAVASMALVVTLSVFNGFHDLVESLFTAMDPQLTVIPKEGKSVPADDPVLDKIRKMPEVEVAMDCVEDNALAVYGDRQTMVKIKGVEDSFVELTRIKDILYGEGEFVLQAANLQYGIMGIRLAETLGTSARWDGFLKVFAPKREGLLDMANPAEGFVEDSLLSPGVVFYVKQAKYDASYIIVPISFARELFDRYGMITSLELRLKDEASTDRVKDEIRAAAGDRYKVLDRYEQQEDTFKIMTIEKLMAYIFLTFILSVACFNIIGSLSMLIIDKKDDVVTLRNLGATDRQIMRIFLFEGRLIAIVGAAAGIIMGLFLCLLQQTFGIVKLGSSSGLFIIDAYPVSIHASDMALVFVTVLVVSFLAVWYPVRHFSRRLLK